MMVSDVFDLAGCFGLPQNSATFAGERGPANLDARYRLSYSFIYDVPSLKSLPDSVHLFGRRNADRQYCRFQTGQPHRQ